MYILRTKKRKERAMTADEAIEILSEHSKLVLVDLNPDLKKAMRLGIEATELVTKIRQYNRPYFGELLPSETAK